MPFKSGKSPADLSASIKKRLLERLPKQIEKALYTMGNEMGAASDHYVPVDSANLVNSRALRVTQTADGWRLTISYYGKQAGALHSPKTGSKMDGWKPKPPGSPGKPTGGYNPNAKQDWLNVAWREEGDRLIKEFAEDIKK
jgi:hypothetical protein